MRDDLDVGRGYGLGDAHVPSGAPDEAAGPGAGDVMGTLGQVSTREGLSALGMRLGELRAWLADDLRSMEAELADVSPADAPDADLADRAATHLLARPGKRIRPICVLLAARAGGRDADQTVRDLAVACELTHAATLLHDDVLDLGTERRGAPTSRILYGNSASVLGGDHLLVEALRRVRRTGLDPLLDRLLTVIQQMIRAEALQLARRGRFEPDREAYLAIARGKTAALFRWGLEAGAFAAGLPGHAQAALGRLGEHLGLAFQLVDDLLDLEGDPEVTGKDALVDLAEGKLTWPLVVASERDPALAARLEELALDPSQLAVASVAHQVRRDVRATGAVEATRREAHRAAHAAREELAALDGPAHARVRAALEAVVDAAIARSA